MCRLRSTHTYTRWAVSVAKGGRTVNEIPTGGMQPQTQPSPQSSPSEDLLRKLTLVASDSTGWMKFLGVMLVLAGVILIVSIWGILICWLPIWAGIVLFKAAGDADMASRGAPTRLLELLQKNNKFFMVLGIFALIMIIVLIAIFVIAGVAVFMSLGGFM
jgi:hypothetical protein